MRYLMIACLCFVTIISNAQIETVKLPDIIKIGEVTYMGQFVAELHYIPVKNDTTYSLLFDNQKYSSISDLERVEFQSSPGILDTLYNLFSKSFDLEKGKQTTFYLG